MDHIAILNFAYPDGIRKMMASDCLNVPIDILPSPALVGDGFIRFGIPQVVMLLIDLKNASFQISIRPYSLPY